jgi:hypothetical protein
MNTGASPDLHTVRIYVPLFHPIASGPNPNLLHLDRLRSDLHPLPVPSDRIRLHPFGLHLFHRITSAVIGSISICFNRITSAYIGSISICFNRITSAYIGSISI